MPLETNVTEGVSKSDNGKKNEISEEYMAVGPKKIILPKRFERFYDDIQNFEVRDEDVFLLAFPKTGSRWTLEMVWLLINNLDFKKASEVSLQERAPLLEFETLFEKFPYPPNYIQRLGQINNPRCIRTHLEWSLLPKAIQNSTKQPKLVVIYRNPEDTCTSYYYQVKAMEGYSESWDTFCDEFLEGKVLFGPFWEHVLGLWEQRHRPNIFFIYYDKMKHNLEGTIREVAAFLGKEISDDDVVKMREHLTFDNLKQSKGFNLEGLMSTMGYKVNPFIRSGTVGDHKNVMSAEVIKAFQKQKEDYIRGTGLSFV